MMLGHIAKHRNSTTIENEAKLSAAYKIPVSYIQPVSTTSIDPISAKNTIHMYKPDAVDFSETILQDVKKLMLIQVRPKDHETSAHALYVWAHQDQLVSELTKTIQFLRYGQDYGLTRNLGATFLWIPTSNKVFDWDGALKE